MPIVTYDEYLAKITAPRQRLNLLKENVLGTTTLLRSLWTQPPLSGAVPTAPLAPTNLTPGALSFINSLAVQRLAQVEVASRMSHMQIICDRLSHQGGLSGVVTTLQTTNLPTAALTRYIDGRGVFAAIEIYSAVGGTVTTLTVSYTNELGVSGQTSQPIVFGGTADRDALNLLILPLAAGDQGVRSVESVTVSVTTGTAGNFGVTLFRPLMMLPVISRHQLSFNSIIGGGGNMPVIPNNSCLFAVVAPLSSESAAFFSTQATIIQE